MNEQTRAAIETATRLARDAQPVAKKVGGFLLQHKAGVVITVLLLYILWPKSAAESRTRTETSVSVTQTASSTAKPTTQPEIPGLSLYDPAVNTEWGLPLQLSSQELQTLAHDVEKLFADTLQAGQLAEQYHDLCNQLTDDEILNPLWAALLRNGFKDKNLPLDWFQAVKGRDSVLETGAAWVEYIANDQARTAILTRLNYAKMHLLGGRAETGDRLFTQALQLYITGQLQHYRKVLPLAQNVQQRLAKELPDFAAKLNAEAAQSKQDEEDMKEFGISMPRRPSTRKGF